MSAAPAINPPARPTAEQIDQIAATLHALGILAAEADGNFAEAEKNAVDLVLAFGTVPAHAENSRVLSGTYNELMVIIGNRITIDESRVQDLKAALEANSFGHLFPYLFLPRVRHELVKDADKAILAAGMPKRLTEKVQALYGRCFDAQKKSPSLKVKTIVEKPAKKKREPKAPKAEAQQGGE